jgi:hypothetical protein
VGEIQQLHKELKRIMRSPVPEKWHLAVQHALELAQSETTAEFWLTCDKSFG